MSSRYQYTLRKHPVEFGVLVRVDSLKIDPQAQRTLNEKRAQTMADSLIEEAVGSVVVSERSNGELFIVDGMHRHRAFQLNGIPEITAEVHKGLDQQEEAILFLIKNRESNKPSALDEFKVGLTAGLPLFVDTNRVLAKRGLSLGSTSANSVGAVSGLIRITDNYGADVLDRSLAIAEAAGGRTQYTWDGMLLGGLGMFLGRHGDLIDDQELGAKMAKVGPPQMWIGKIHAASSAGGTQNSGTGNRLSAAYNLIVHTWNKGKSKNKIVL